MRIEELEDEVGKRKEGEIAAARNILNFILNYPPQKSWETLILKPKIVLSPSIDLNKKIKNSIFNIKNGRIYGRVYLGYIDRRVALKRFLKSIMESNAEYALLSTTLKYEEDSNPIPLRFPIKTFIPQLRRMKFQEPNMSGQLLFTLSSEEIVFEGVVSSESYQPDMKIIR